MKNSIKIFALFMVIIFTFSSTVYAGNSTYIYTYDNIEVSITHSGLSEEKASYIADMLISGQTIDATQTYGLTCTLFGHKLKTASSEIVTHMVYETYPHCKCEYYNVTTCERCDYMKTELISTEPIGCCVE